MPMKSRRRIAFPKVKLRDLVLQLQQGLPSLGNVKHLDYPTPL
jgi:hypothetical protein